MKPGLRGALRALAGLGAAGVLLLAAAGAGAASPAGAGYSDAAAAGETFAPSGFVLTRVQHVVVISIDGLRSDAISRLGEAGTPNLHRLMREGATTLNARNMLERTVTLPNHTSMVTGERIDPTAGGHGVGFNADNGRTVHDMAGRYVASVFDVVHDHGGSTAFLVGKTKFDLLDRSWDEVNGGPDTVGADDGRDKITAYVPSTDPTALVVESLGSSRPYTFTFLHLPQPDRAGHAHKWMSKRYLAAVEEADALVGEVLAAIDASPQRSADTVVILTSDHGGMGNGHSEVDRLQNYRIPFMVWGVDVAAGSDLYALNAGTRLDPGVARPGYEGTQPIRNGEVANLVTDLLGYPPVPGSLFDLAQDLAVN